jgi:glycopeptide antibiotics resistance protein
MKDVLLIGYELLTVILPFIITFVILSLLYRHKKIEKINGHFLIMFIFSLYIFAVFFVTGAGTIYNLQSYGFHLDGGQLNILPFSQNIDIADYLLNILLFIPYGFLLPLIWPNINKLKYVLLSGVSFSLLIEISQSINNRRTDIDDLLMNTLGALLGYLLFKMFIRLTKRSVKPVIHFKLEMAIYILALFIGHFFLFNEFGLVKILYGY